MLQLSITFPSLKEKSIFKISKQIFLWYILKLYFLLACICKHISYTCLYISPQSSTYQVYFSFIIIYLCDFFFLLFSRLESKKYETLKHELDDMKKKLNASSADNNRLKNNLNISDGKEKQQRKRIDEINQQMVEYEENMRLANKEKVIILNWFINSLSTIHNHWWWWIIYKLFDSFVSEEFKTICANALNYYINLYYFYY